MDKTRFWFVWYEPEEAIFRFKHIKSIMTPTIAERRGTIIATLALHLLEYLCNQRFPQITRLRKTNYDSGVTRNAPWARRRRFMAIKPSQSKLYKSDAETGVPIEFCFNDIHRSQWLRWHFDPLSAIHYDSIFNLLYVLDRLPTLLKHAAEDNDLIAFASQHTIFPQQAFHFPGLTTRAQNAINAYLAKFAANPPVIPLPEYVGPDKRWEYKLGSPWNRIFVLFPHFLAFIVFICFLSIPCFA
jgi:hypothetical protein